RVFKKLKTGPVSKVQTHERYATASDSLISEAHPHVFSPATTEEKWVQNGTAWAKETVEWQNTVTANGDFDNLIKPNGHVEERTFGYNGKMYSFSQFRIVAQYL